MAYYRFTQSKGEEIRDLILLLGNTVPDLMPLNPQKSSKKNNQPPKIIFGSSQNINYAGVQYWLRQYGRRAFDTGPLKNLIPDKDGQTTASDKKPGIDTLQYLVDLVDALNALLDDCMAKEGAITRALEEGRAHEIEFSETPDGEGIDYEVIGDAPTSPKSYMLLGVPPGWPPANYVERPQFLDAVKRQLLSPIGESEQTVVVSAIAGMGGIGKSVLANALVHDPAVQAQFPDGVLWATLGQNPDLLSILGDWIRTLDKSKNAWSADTIASASSYLQSLLIEKQMLLVVDDVWISDHAKWFQVGGTGCRTLITTREAQIAGAAYVRLEVMSELEALKLARKALGDRWDLSQENAFQSFAKVVGYLPLALDLSARLIAQEAGLTWQELRDEFLAERRSVATGTGYYSGALTLLDSSEQWESLPEEQQRLYSLQACLNLSLKRLNAEPAQKFAWLGVLPEDVNLSAGVAVVLWNLSTFQTKRLLALLRDRSLLTDGPLVVQKTPETSQIPSSQ